VVRVPSGVVSSQSAQDGATVAVGCTPTAPVTDGAAARWAAARSASGTSTTVAPAASDAPVAARTSRAAVRFGTGTRRSSATAYSEPDPVPSTTEAFRQSAGPGASTV
jgi:hypothetical protein